MWFWKITILTQFFRISDIHYVGLFFVAALLNQCNKMKRRNVYSSHFNLLYTGSAMQQQITDPIFYPVYQSCLSWKQEIFQRADKGHDEGVIFHLSLLRKFGHGFHEVHRGVRVSREARFRIAPCWEARVYLRTKYREMRQRSSRRSRARGESASNTPGIIHSRSYFRL